MRLWSIHPQYLDTKGLVALWREGLLALHVLQGKTKGYKNHPQLHRFKNSNQTLRLIHSYLSEVWKEADRRDYQFDRSKIRFYPIENQIDVMSGQIEFEVSHLKKKLKLRDPGSYQKVKGIKKIKLHPLFKKVRGGIESWEVL